MSHSYCSLGVEIREGPEFSEGPYRYAFLQVGPELVSAVRRTDREGCTLWAFGTERWFPTLADLVSAYLVAGEDST